MKALMRNTNIHGNFKAFTILLMTLVLVGQVCLIVQANESSDEASFHAQKLVRSLIQRQNIREFALLYGLKVPEPMKSSTIEEGGFDESSFDWDLDERVKVTNHFDALSLNCRKTVVSCLYAQKAIKTHFEQTQSLQNFIQQKLDPCGPEAKNVFHELYSNHAKGISDLIFEALILKANTKLSMPLVGAVVGAFFIMVYLVSQMNQTSAQLAQSKKESTKLHHDMKTVIENHKENEAKVSTLKQQLEDKNTLLNEATISLQENKRAMQFTKDRLERLENEKQDLEKKNRDQEKQIKDYTRECLQRDAKWKESNKQLEKDLSQMSQEVNKLRQENNSASQVISSLEFDKLQLMSKVEDDTLTVSKLKNEVNNVRKQLLSQIEQHTAVVLSMQKEISKLQTEITNKSMEYNKIWSELNTLNVEKSELETDNKIFESENKNLKESLNHALKDLSVARSELKSKSVDTEKLEKHLQDTKQQYDHTLQLMDDLKSKLQVQESELSNVKHTLEEQNERLTGEISKHEQENMRLTHIVEKYRLEIQMKEKEIEEKDQIIYSLKSECIVIEDLRTEITKKSSTLEEKIMEMGKLQQDLILLKKNKDLQEKSYSELGSALKKQQSEYEEKITSLTRELDEATSTAAHLLNDSNKMKEALDRANLMQNELESQHTAAINELNHKLQENALLMSEKEEEIKKLYQQIDAQTYASMKKNEELIKYKEQIDSHQKVLENISSLENANASLNSQLETIRNAYEKQLNTLKESKAAEIKVFKKSIMELEHRVGLYEKKVAQSNTQITEQLKKIDELQNKAKEKNSDSAFTTTLEQRSQQERDLELLLEKKDTELNSLKSQLSDLSLKYQLLQGANATSLLDENTKLKKQLENLQDTKQKLMNNYNQEKATCEKLRTELSRLNSAMKKKK
ncbi:hypothetical protein C9374_003220 [Naegleria lovaniensis]|uniref:Uncharacterized protein n=1 Tax=Naegleria lovaniensis TaxID=51637 RepID=A0AA88GPQ9_NAELO|nr:uncharacterized protein C9374_003220 [Naegleria lovaniensis]KAG2386071.1 hypothetical protein C9374_003220 [Naegleria lovaniensis]